MRFRLSCFNESSQRQPDSNMMKIEMKINKPITFQSFYVYTGFQKEQQCEIRQMYVDNELARQSEKIIKSVIHTCKF